MQVEISQLEKETGQHYEASKIFSGLKNCKSIPQLRSLGVILSVEPASSTCETIETANEED